MSCTPSRTHDATAAGGRPASACWPARWPPQLITAVPTAAQAAPTLLSQGRPATASSSESVAFPASAAVDGDAGTRWSSQFSDPQWLQIDLGGPHAVTQVRLSWETAYAKAFSVQTSNDGTTWNTAYTTTTGTGGDQTVAVTATARYVRLDATQRATQWGYSLWEFQVFGGDTTPPGQDILLSYGKPSVASTDQDDVNCGGCVPAKAFDFDPATRWATSSTTGWVDPGWIYVDLGARATVHKGRPAVGSSLRHRLPAPGFRRRRHLDTDLLHHHG
jgi:hypothetical protein